MLVSRRPTFVPSVHPFSVFSASRDSAESGTKSFVPFPSIAINKLTTIVLLPCISISSLTKYSGPTFRADRLQSWQEIDYFRPVRPLAAALSYLSSLDALLGRRRQRVLCVLFRVLSTEVPLERNGTLFESPAPKGRSYSSHQSLQKYTGMDDAVSSINIKSLSPDARSPHTSISEM